MGKISVELIASETDPPLRSSEYQAGLKNVASALQTANAKVSQEHLRRQCCHWSHTGMRQQAQRLGPLLDLSFYLPVQLLDPLLQLHV